MASLTCSTAVVCCLVLSSISRAASVVVSTRRAICWNEVETSRNCRGSGVDGLRPGFGRHHRGVNGGADLLDQRPDVLGGTADSVRELADLVGHDAETAPGVAGAGGLDRGVDGQDVGLFGEFIDHFQDAADLLRLAPQVEHVRDDDVHLSADAGDGLLGPLDGVVARARPGRGLLRDPGDPLGAFGDLPGGRHEFLDSGGDLAHRRGLFARDGGLLTGRRLEFAGRTLEPLKGGADLATQGGDEIPTEERDERRPAETPPQDHDFGQIGRGFGSSTPRFKQILFLFVHFSDYLADDVHHLLAFVRGHDLGRRLESLLASLVDGPLQFG